MVQPQTGGDLDEPPARLGGGPARGDGEGQYPQQVADARVAITVSAERGGWIPRIQADAKRVEVVFTGGQGLLQ